MKTTLITKLATAAAATGIAFAALAGPAGAAPGDSTTTFAITGGSLSISVPTPSGPIATVATGALLASGQLGSVAVGDTRGALVNAWTTSVSSTSFVTGTGTPAAAQTVATTNIAYSSGASTSTTGLGAFVPGTLATMAAPGTGAAWTGAAGNSTAAWNPTLNFTLLSSQVAGTYTGTVTHSVA